jgi:D-alanine-D-alanine ligase
MPPRVLVLYNEPVLPRDHPDAEAEHTIQVTAEVVRKILAGAGHAVAKLAVGRDPGRLLSGLRQHRPEVVFNLFEGTADQAESEAYVAGLLQWLGLPFTGSPAEALALARNKPLAKTLFRGAGLPSPAFVVVDRMPAPSCPLTWPVIVKPGAQDASIGLDQGSVVTDHVSLDRRVASLLERYGPPVLIEQYIAGRELVVALIEAPDLQTLPVEEIVFADKSPGYWPIVTYTAKWDPDSYECQATPPRYPAEISEELARRLADLAKAAFRLLGCRDYARVDFRLSEAGAPYILEVNPNPDFGPDAGLDSGLRAGGLTHESFTIRLVENALRRASFYKGISRGPPW